MPNKSLQVGRENVARLERTESTSFAACASLELNVVSLSEGYRMRLAPGIVVWLCVVIGSAFPCFAKEWHGIVPLQSTRSDVIKLLGPPRHLLWDYRDYFEIENGIVTSEWIDPSCLRKYPVEPDEAIRPDDLVLSIAIRLKKPLSASEFAFARGQILFSMRWQRLRAPLHSHGRWLQLCDIERRGDQPFMCPQPKRL
jgi:hypothetical protein